MAVQVSGVGEFLCVAYADPVLDSLFREEVLRGEEFGALNLTGSCVVPHLAVAFESSIGHMDGPDNVERESYASGMWPLPCFLPPVARFDGLIHSAFFSPNLSKTNPRQTLTIGPTMNPMHPELAPLIK